MSKLPGDFMDKTGRIMDVLSKFLQQRRGEGSCKLRGKCPVCKTHMVQFRYNGPRAIRMWCENPDCYVRMLS